MQYKALFIDVDGTLVPNASKDVPTPQVTNAIARAREKGLHVGVVTGRPIQYLHNIFDHLSLEGPSIIVDGAQVVDSQTRKVIWEQTMSLEDVEKVRKIIFQFAKRVTINANGVDTHLVEDEVYEKPLGMYIDSLKEPLADALISALSHIPTIKVGKMTSWTTGQLDVWVSHVYATKQHGMLKAAEILGISTKEIIGIGDSYNDFPLMMASGLKVAMGNAIPDLKAIADYIAPSVEEDGVAHVIGKFILSE